MAKLRWTESKPSEFVAVVENDVHDKLRKTALNFHNHVAFLSPVDTGVFRRNNIVSLENPDFTQKADGNYSANEGMVRALIMSAPKGTKRIYIQNNLPYAERLENGYSSQAPLGIYKIAFEAISGVR